MKDRKIEELIKQALREDAPFGDITTDNLIDPDMHLSARVIVKEDGIVSGLSIAKQVYKIVDEDVEFLSYYSDGESVLKGAAIATINGNARSILLGERVMLNILQRMSGIATLTGKYVEKIEGYDVRIADTRKTTPMLRILEKMAVKHGGGYNHRFSLSDAVMIKDNHIIAANGIENAINQVRAKVSHTVKVEVEVETLEQFEEALKAQADIIMLDNMNCEDMKKAVELNDGQAIIEASGNMTLDRLEDVAKTGVNVISVGAVTHSVKSLDISLRFQ